MNKKRAITVFTLTILAFFLMNIFAIAKEPFKPKVNRKLAPEKEGKIRELENLSMELTFERLKSVDFLGDNDLLHRAIFTSFRYRKNAAIDYSLQYLERPSVQFENDMPVSRANELYVAKKVFEVFPSEAADTLLELYDSSGPVTRGNVVRVSGKLAGGDAIRNLLINALNDKAFCENEHPEMTEKPLRVCDVAYNQLVLRYSIKNVLRTIGPIYNIEIRDYHIDILKNLL